LKSGNQDSLSDKIEAEFEQERETARKKHEKLEMEIKVLQETINNLKEENKLQVSAQEKNKIKFEEEKEKLKNHIKLESSVNINGCLKKRDKISIYY